MDISGTVGGFVGFSIQTWDFSSHLLPNVQNNNNPTAARLVMNNDLKYDFSIHKQWK